MREDRLRQSMRKKKIAESFIDQYVRTIRELEDYLCGEAMLGDIDDTTSENIQRFITTSEKDRKEVGLLLYALKSYSVATSNPQMKKAVDRLLGKGAWLNRLSDTLDKCLGEKKRREIMEAGGKISESSSTDRKASWTKCMMKCLKANTDEETCRKIMSNNLHAKSPDTGYIRRLKATYNKHGDIDDVLRSMREDWLNRIEKKYGRLSRLYKLVENDPTIEAGVRRGNVIYVSKIPFDLNASLRATDEEEKKYHLCHRKWVRAALLKGVEHAISHVFCYCSGGWHKQVFEAVLGKPLKAEVINSILKGDNNCKFAIHIPN